MKNEYKLAPFSKQDRLGDLILKTEEDFYVKFHEITFYVQGRSYWGIACQARQDMLQKEGLVKMTNKVYIPLGKIEKIKIKYKN